MTILGEQEYGGDDIVQVPVPRRLLPLVFRILADGMAPATSAATALTNNLPQATLARRESMIDLIIEVARKMGADQSPVLLRELHDAYLRAYPGISKGKPSYSFDATICYYTINMPARFPDKNDTHKSASWLSKPAFKRVGRGQYKLLSDEEKTWFRQCVEEGNPLIYTPDYIVDEVRAVNL